MRLLKRIIFCLYYKEGFFHLSRNFKLQRVGDVDWLIKNFGFGNTANNIDELIMTSYCLDIRNHEVNIRKHKLNIRN